MPAAGRAQTADRRGIDAVVASMHFEPADGVVDVLELRGIRVAGCQPEIERRHHDAARREVAVHAKVVLAGAGAPLPAVHIDQTGEWPRVLRLVDAGGQRLVAVAQVLHVDHLDVIRSVGVVRH